MGCNHAATHNLYTTAVPLQQQFQVEVFKMWTITCNSLRWVFKHHYFQLPQILLGLEKTISFSCEFSRKLSYSSKQPWKLTQQFLFFWREWFSSFQLHIRTWPGQVCPSLVETDSQICFIYYPHKTAWRISCLSYYSNCPKEKHTIETQLHHGT